MAFIQRVVIEVDAATGNDNNGGGFDDFSGAPGTNRAWGANQLATSVTDITTAGAGSTFTSAILSALSGGAAGCVGNIINVQSGTNLLTGRYQILSQAAGTFTVDRAISTGASGGVSTGIMGGSLATIQKGIDVAFINAGAIADARVYIKKGAYTSTLALTNTGAVSASSFRSRVIGYFTAHDDDPTPQSGNQPTFAVGSGAGVNGITVGASGIVFESLTLDGTATSGTRGLNGLSSSSPSFVIWNSKIVNFSSSGVTNVAAACGIYCCDISLCGLNGVNASTSTMIFGCFIHKNSGSGVAASTNGSSVTLCVLANNTLDGITIDYNSLLLNNTCYGNGRDGIRVNSGVFRDSIATMWQNNLLAKNGGWGLNALNSGALPARIQRLDYNAYYGNGSGTATNVSLGDHDVVITVNPFVSSDVDLAAETAPNFALNSTALAGAAVRGAGFPGVLPNLTTSTGYRDIGAFQHQDTGGGGGGGRSAQLVGAAANIVSRL